MVSKGLRERTKQLPCKSLKENKDPACAVSRQCGSVATVASMKKSGKPSAASKNEGIKLRLILPGPEKNVPSKKSQPQTMPDSGPSQPAHSLPKVLHVGEESKKKVTLLPLVTPKCLAEPKQSKVAFQAPVEDSWSRRRLSAPDASCPSSPLKSILKKRNSICTDSGLHRMHSTLQPFSIIWDIPWEREGSFPPIASKGLLLFHDEVTELPPVRRHSLQANYCYSQEFTQVLQDLKNQPSTQQDAPFSDTTKHGKTPELQTSQHPSTRTLDEALPDLVQLGSAIRRFSQ